MAIADFTPERTEISFKGKPLMSVRGLSLEDVSSLIRDHLDDLNRMVELQQGAMRDIYARLNQDGFVIKLLSDFPGVCAEAIAIASGEGTSDENITTIRGMPAGLQVLALRAIAKLTLEDIGGPKGLSALFASMRTQTN